MRRELPALHRLLLDQQRTTRPRSARGQRYRMSGQAARDSPTSRCGWPRCWTETEVTRNFEQPRQQFQAIPCGVGRDAPLPTTVWNPMTFNPLEQRGIPLDKQLRSWRELDVDPVDPDHSDP